MPLCDQAIIDNPVTAVTIIKINISMLQPLNHFLSFILPVSTCLFLVSGTHSLSEALGWTAPFWLLLLIDWRGPASTRPSPNTLPDFFYDLILYALTLLQWSNIYLMLNYIQELHWQTPRDVFTGVINLIALRFMVGTSSGTSGIVVAHELIHRRNPFMQMMGRILLCTVCYDHFVISHKRGHHTSLGMPDDIATARLGESFEHYWRRVYSGYFRYAWNSEMSRLELNTQPFQLRILHNQVLQGLFIEWVGILLILWIYGWLAVVMFLYQAFAAVRILEAVNYFQHWGLSEGRFGQSFGWVTDSWVTRYALIGLSNHIGHHLDERCHFHKIAFSDQGPRLPYGYFVMNLWVKLNNPSFQKMAISRLKRFSEKQPVTL